MIRRGGVAEASAPGFDRADASADALAEWLESNGGGAVVRAKVGSRGRGLFALRDIRKGEVVISVPLSLCLTDVDSRPPYPGCPYSVTLAAAILTERDAGESSRWARYVASLPEEIVGYAGNRVGYDEAVIGAEVGGDEAVREELQTYAALVAGSHAAVGAWTARQWRWAMSAVHSRTFRVELERAGRKRRTARLLAPFADLLNHDSDPNLVCCEWDVERAAGEESLAGEESGVDDVDGFELVVRASRNIPKGREAIVSYGERSDVHFFLYYGFLPEPNPHNRAPLFRTLDEAAVWYERLCGDPPESEKAWARARADAVAAIDPSGGLGDEGEDGDGATLAAAREAASLDVGENSTVDDRLLRLYSILSGDEDVAIAAIRLRASGVLREGEDESEEGSSEAGALAARFRERRRKLLKQIV